MSEVSPEQATLARLQDERWADPATKRAAQERAERAGATIKRNEWRLTLQDRQVKSAADFKHKVYWLRQLAQTWAEAVEPEAPCQEGCSACCYQPVMLSAREAAVIGREIDVAPTMPKAWRTDPGPFSGDACPFLQGARCTIYKARPMACRTLYSMDGDALLCTIIPGAAAKVPYADAMALHLRYVEAHLAKPMSRAEDPAQLEAAIQSVHLADIRDFFPHGKQLPLL